MWQLRGCNYWAAIIGLQLLGCNYWAAIIELQDYCGAAGAWGG